MAGADQVPAVRVLGPLEVDGRDGPIALGGHKPRVVLTLLLTEVGRVVSTDRLIDALWGDAPPETAEATLQTYVSRLRRAVDGVITISTRGPGYCAEVAPADLDVAQAEAAIGEGRVRAAAGEHHAAAEALAGAIALWRGRPLGDCADESWARPEVNRLTELRLAAWEDLADARLALGEHRHLAGTLAALVEEAPLREGLIARLVVALARSGRQVDGLAVLRRHREHLREDLGLDPGPTLERLESDLLAQQPDVVGPADTVRPAAPQLDARESLAGRVAERAALGRAIDRLRSGAGSVVVVSGEAGIGKSALGSWAASTAVLAGARVVRVIAIGDEQAPALWPWRPAVLEMLEAIEAGSLPSADAALLRGLGSSSGSADPYAVRLAMASLVGRVAAEGPLMLLVDDLQALDPASLGAVQFLARETGRAPLLLMVIVRVQGDDLTRTLSACLEELARQPLARRLHLEGLAADAVAAVASQVAGRPIGGAVADALAERTGGNPFLVRELAQQVALAGRLDDPRAVADPALVPPTVLEAVRQRIDRLPGDVAEVVRLAAVAGGPADADLLARASGARLDDVVAALERACATGLVVAGSGPGELRFAHSLVAEAALLALGPVGRARRHQALLDALSGRVDRLAIPARARHAIGSLPVGDPSAALDAVIAAGQQAVDDGDPEQATAWWLHGLELLVVSPTSQPEARWELTDALARSRLAAGDLRNGLTTVLDACEEAERLADPVRLARSATAPVEMSLWPWRGYGEVDRRLVRALERAAATVDSSHAALRIRVLGGLAVERYYLPERGPADEAAAAAVALARAHGDPALLALALDLGFVATWRSDRMPELEVLADELVAVAVKAGLDDRTRFVGLFLRLVARLTLGRAEEATADEHELLDLADRVRSPGLLVALDGYRAMRATMHGKHAEADRWIEEGLELYRRTQVWEPRDASLLLLAPIAIERGGADELARPLLDDSAGPAHPLIRRLACIVLAEAGFDDVVREEIARGGPLPAPALDWSWLANACGLAAVAVACRDRDGASAWAVELAPYAGQLAMFGSDGCLGAVDDYRGRCLALCGDPAAGEAFAAATALYRRLGAPHLEARTVLHEASWLADLDPAVARARVDHARGLARSAPALLARLDALA